MNRSRLLLSGLVTIGLTSFIAPRFFGAPVPHTPGASTPRAAERESAEATAEPQGEQAKQTPKSKPGASAPQGDASSPTSKPTRGRRRVDYQANAPADLITYPRDKGKVVATVDGRKVTLGEVIGHIDRFHFPGYEALSHTASGQLEIRSTIMADWIRQYTDTIALRANARERNVSETLIKAEMGAVFEAAFALFKKQYEKRTRQAFPTRPGSVRALRTRFMKLRGLAMEVEGLLNALVSNKLDAAGLYTFFHKHHETMTGYLQISQIYVKNRNEKTGGLLTGAKRQAAEKLVRKIRDLLEKDGVEFEEVAAKYSEDRKSAARGGVLHNLQRFDPRMPASICEAAWGLRNGKWRGPIESRYGIHFIKRISWVITSTIIRPDHTNKDVIEFVWKHHKERYIFKTRADRHVVLKY